MEKEPVTKFDLEAAFKALDELDIPVAEKGIAANRVNLTETFANARNNKLKTELLVEDYYDLNSEEDLEQAKTDREDEIAKAKLARIEKIVDLDAESPEDLQPSYVGKVIIQCPQCMTLFYKDPADIEPSEDDESVVNINEVCQHCGNASGYNVIGKVGAVSEEEADNFDETEAEETPVEEDELSLDFEEPTEEVDAEGTGEAETTLEEPTEEETEDELNLDFTDAKEEEEEEEKKEESLNHSKVEREAEEGSDLFTEHKTENVSLNEEAETVDESINNPEAQKEAAENSELATENHSENLSLNEEVVDESINNSEAEKDAATNSELETENHTENASLNEEGNAKWKALSTKPRDLLSKIKDDPNYKATDKYVFYGTDEKGNVLETVEYEHTGDKISELKAERNKVFDKNDKIETVYVSRFYHNIEKDEDEEVEIDSYMISRNKVDESLETEADTLTEASVKELDDKLKAHNEYIEYLKKMIEQEEAALKTATNEEVKAAIQRRLDAFNDDLNAALPEAVKDDLAAEELPTPEEAAEEGASDEAEATEETTESVNKSENITDTEEGTLPDAKTLHEDVITVKVDTAAETPIVTVEQEPSAPIEEPVAEPIAPVEEPCVGPECETPCVGPECETPAEPCVGPECEVVPPVVANIPAVEEPVVVDDVEARMAADANAAVDELAAEFGIDDDVAVVEPGEAEETTETEETEEKEEDDDDDEGNDGSGEAPVEEGILSAAGSVVNGVVDGVKNLLASDEAEKKDLEECSKVTEDAAEDTLMHELETPVSEEEVRDMMSDLRNEDINITNNDSPARVDNRTVDNTAEAPKAEEKPVEEGILGAVGDVIGGVVGGVENLLASDEAEKKSMEECAKTEEGLGLFGIGDVNVNLDASGQNNAVGVGGGEGKTEELETKEGLLPDGLPTPPVKVPGLNEEEIKEDLNEGALEEGPFSWIKGKIDDASFDKAAAKAYDEFAVLVWKPNKNNYRLKDSSDKYLTTESKIYATYKEAKDAAKTKSLANKTCADVFGIPVKGSKKLDTEFIWAFNNGETETDQKRYNEISIYTVKPDDPEAVDNSVPVVKIKRKDVAAEAKVQAAKSKLNKSTDKGSDADIEHEPHEVAEGTMPAAADIDSASKVIDGEGNKYVVQTGPDAAHDTNIFKTFTDAERRAKEYSNWAKGATVQLGMKRDSDGAELRITYKNNALEKGNIARLVKYVKGEALSESYNYSIIEDFDEKSFNEHILAFLTETYSNVKNFETTACNFDNNSLVVEGMISFESGKTKATKFEFSPVSAGEAVFFEGLNNDIYKEGKAFILNCSTLDEGKTLITESLQYSYNVNGTAINGIK